MEYTDLSKVYEEFDWTYAQLRRFASRSSAFNEKPFTRLHERFPAGRRFVSDKHSILLLIEEYTDKLRVVLIVK